MSSGRSKMYPESVNDDLLIEAVKAQPCIYDKQHKHYNDREYLRKVWTDIGNEIGCDAHDCKSRWCYLRDYFLKKHKEVVRTMSYGKRKRKWVYYDQLSFLIPMINPRLLQVPGSGDGDMETSAHASEQDTQDGSWDAEAIDNDYIAALTAQQQSPAHSLSDDGGAGNSKEVPPVRQHSSTTPGRSKVVKDLPGSDDTVEEELLKILRQNQRPPQMDENELFLRSLVPALKSMSRLKSMQFRHEVQGLMLRYLQEEQEGSTSNTSRSNGDDRKE